MTSRLGGWLWKCLLCGHTRYDDDGLDAFEAWQRHYVEECPKRGAA